MLRSLWGNVLLSVASCRKNRLKFAMCIQHLIMDNNWIMLHREAFKWTLMNKWILAQISSRVYPSRFKGPGLLQTWNIIFRRFAPRVLRINLLSCKGVLSSNIVQGGGRIDPPVSRELLDQSIWNFELLFFRPLQKRQQTLVLGFLGGGVELGKWLPPPN